VNGLIGTYECKADAKGRMMLPAALKKQLDPILQDGFVFGIVPHERMGGDDDTSAWFESFCEKEQ
jgi:hypothetical protein